MEFQDPGQRCARADNSAVPYHEKWLLKKGQLRIAIPDKPVR